MTSRIKKGAYAFTILVTLISCSKKETEIPSVNNSGDYKHRIVSVEIAQLIAENFSPSMFNP